MQIHNVQKKHRNKKKKLIGRGGARGTYSGRGVKGQKAHAGRKIRPELRDIIKKLPKKRGYRFASIQDKPIPLDGAVLERAFSSGERVTAKALVAKGIIRQEKGRIPKIKILGKTTFSKKITISGIVVSKSAKDAIVKAGGSVDK